MSNWKERFWFDVGRLVVELPDGHLVRVPGPPPYGSDHDDDHLLYQVSYLAELWWPVMFATLTDRPDPRDYRGKRRTVGLKEAKRRHARMERLCLKIGYKLFRVRREMADWVRYRYEHPTWVSRPRYRDTRYRQVALVMLAVYGSLAAETLEQMPRLAGDKEFIQASLRPVAFDDLPRLYELAA